MGVIRTKVGNFIGSANDTLDQLTSLSASLLCLPALLKKFLSPGFYKAGFRAIIGIITNTVTDIIRDVLNTSINRILNYVNWFIDSQIENIRDAINAVKDIINLVLSIFKRIRDVIDFVKNQENCAFRASEMLSCIVHEVQRKVKNNTVREIQNNLNKYIDDFADEVSNTNGAIDRYLNRNLDFLDKARREIELQNLFK